MEIINILKRQLNQLITRTDLVKKYVRWIIDKDRSNNPEYIIIPQKPSEYINPHETILKRNIIEYHGFKYIKNIKYIIYKINLEKLEKYIKYLEKRKKTYKKVITYIRSGKKLKSRTPEYKLYKYYKEVYKNEKFRQKN